LAPRSSPSPDCCLIHVSVGIVVLLVIGFRHKGGRSDADEVETTGLYWHFVDLVWMFVVPLVSGGPGALPQSVLEQTQRAIRQVPGQELSVLGMSHRSH